jgi:hypothetical protein
VRGGGEEHVETELISVGERETGGVVVSVDVIGLDGVEPLGLAQIQPRLEQRREDGELTDIEPTLSRPAVRAPCDRLRKESSIRPPRFPGARAHVADDAASLLVQGGDDGRRRVEQVEAVDLDVNGQVGRSGQLPLPGRTDARTPHLTGGLRPRADGGDCGNKNQQQKCVRPHSARRRRRSRAGSALLRF